MKKKLFRLFALLLCATMLFPSWSLMLSAEPTLTNHYDPSTSVANAVPATGSLEGLTTVSGFFAGAAITVTAGDKIYFGPCDTTHSWHLALYTSATAGTTVGKTAFTVEDTFSDGSVIYSYAIPANVISVRLAGKARYQAVTLLTINQAFDQEAYFAYADSVGLELDATLRPPVVTPPVVEGPIVNRYDAATSITNAVPANTNINANTTISGYFGSAVISVSAGDKLYFGPCDRTQGWNVAIYSSETTLSQYGKAYFTVEDTFADGSVIYSYTIPNGYTSIRYAGKTRFQSTTLLTVNQAFDKEAYFAFADEAGWTLDENLRPEEAPLTNRYDSATSTANAVPGTAGTDAITALNGYFGSAAIAATAGATIYVGPCAPTHQWHLACYTATGGITANRTNYTVVDTFADGSVIYSFTIPNTGAYTAVRLTGLMRFQNITLLTVNQPFDKDAYFTFADEAGWVLDTSLRPLDLTPPAMADVADANALVNLYPRVGACDETLQQYTNVDTYKTSDYIAVASGDVVTIGALRQASSGEALLLYNSAKALIASIGTDSLPLHEDIGRGYGIYWMTVPSGVAYIQAKVHIGVYNDGDVLVTKNQPFTGDQFRTALGINYYLEGADEHPFFGKTALFIGDSISYGSFDTPPSYRNPSASWARRLVLSTGLEVTNASIGGAAIRECSRTWVYNQYASQSNKDFDLIVMHGGVNDARDSAALGVILPIGTDEATLKGSTATFAGGLQWLFYNVRKDSPDAELYYIANFKLTDPTGNAQDMSGYFALAAELCELYGIYLIDLYNNTELYKTYDPANTEILPDKLHPTKAGYDLLFPTVLQLFDESLYEVTFKRSASYKDSIFLNFYLNIPESVDLNNVKIVITYANPDTPALILDALTRVTLEDSVTYSRITCPLTAKELADVITVEVFDGERQIGVLRASFQDYAKVILAHDAITKEEKDLVTACLNYGAAAQIFQNYNAENLANSILESN